MHRPSLAACCFASGLLLGCDKPGSNFPAAAAENAAAATTWSGLLAGGSEARDRGEYADAAPLLQRALSLAETAFGRDSPKLIKVLDELAMCQRDLEQFEPADFNFRRELALQERAHGRRSLEVALVLNDLAQNYADQRDAVQAAPLLDEALSILTALPDPREHRGSLSVVLHNLGGVRYFQSRNAEAEDLWQRALAIRLELYGESSSQTATTLYNLAQLTSDDEDRLKESEQWYRRALAAYEASKGANHPDVALTLIALAELPCEGQGCNAAVPLFERALAIYARAYGEDHALQLDPLERLAEIHESAHRYAQALPLRLRLLDLTRRTAGDRGRLMLAHEALAELYTKLKDPRNASLHQAQYDKLVAELPNEDD